MTESPHMLPEDDHFEHEESPYCPCSPEMWTICVPKRGYVQKWKHQLVQEHSTPAYVPLSWS